MRLPWRSWFLILIFAGCFLLVWAPTSSDRAISLEGSAKIDFLLKNLESAKDYKVRIAAANELGKVADGTVVDWILRAFRQEGNDAVRLATLYAVGQIPDHRMLPPLIELAQQEVLSEKESIAIERIFWNFRGAVHIPSWRNALTDSQNRYERAVSAWLLGLVGSEKEVGVLVAALSDRTSSVRMRAVHALGKIGARRALPYCRRLADQDRDPKVRKAAQSCVHLITLRARKKLPRDKSHRVKLKIDFYGLQENSVTPALYRDYQKRNVNPRTLDEAVAFLQQEKAEVRQDRTIKLVESKKYRETFWFDAEMVTYYHFSLADLKRLKQTVSDRAGYVNQCYLREVKKNRKLAGNVQVQFRVLRDGKVSSTKVLGGSLKHKGVRSCILEKLAQIKFPEIPYKFVTMKYNYAFQPPKDKKYEF